MFVLVTELCIDVKPGHLSPYLFSCNAYVSMFSMFFGHLMIFKGFSVSFNLSMQVENNTTCWVVANYSRLCIPANHKWHLALEKPCSEPKALTWSPNALDTKLNWAQCNGTIKRIRPLQDSEDSLPIPVPSIPEQPHKPSVQGLKGQSCSRVRKNWSAAKKDLKVELALF